MQVNAIIKYLKLLRKHTELALKLAKFNTNGKTEEERRNETIH